MESICKPKIILMIDGLLSWGKDSALIDKKIKEIFVPLIKNSKGFVRYY